MTSPDLLEALRSGAVRVVPVEATLEMMASQTGFTPEGLRQEYQRLHDLKIKYSWLLAASPDHTPAVVALIEGLRKERDESVAVAAREKQHALLALEGARLSVAAAEEQGAKDRMTATTVRQMRTIVAETEARALAAEAERDALRERVERAESVEGAAQILYRAWPCASKLPPDVFEHAAGGHFFSALRLLFEPDADLTKPARALTQEQRR